MLFAPRDIPRPSVWPIIIRRIGIGIFAICVLVIGFSVPLLVTSEPETNLGSALLVQTNQPTITVIPSETFTIAPSRTQTPTRTPSNTATDKPTTTPTLTSTQIPTKTLTPTITPTRTPNYAATKTQIVQTIIRQQKAQAIKSTLLNFAKWFFLSILAIIILLIIKDIDWQYIITDAMITYHRLKHEQDDQQMVRLELHQESSIKRSTYRIPGNILRQWCRVALAGGQLGIGSWVGSDKYFERNTSRPERDYEMFRGWFFKHGILARHDPDNIKSKIYVTEQGKEVLRQIIDNELIPDFPYPTYADNV